MTIVGPTRDAGKPMHLRLLPDTETVEVVAFCAPDDVRVLEEATLRAPLRPVRWIVVEAQELEPVRAALTAASPRTLYVVCRSAALSLDDARRVVECFAQEHAPGHRLTVVDVDPQRPGGWIDTVLRAQRAMMANDETGPPNTIDGMVASNEHAAVGGELQVGASKRARRDRAMDSGSSAVSGSSSAIKPRETAVRLSQHAVDPTPAHVRPPTKRHLSLVAPVVDDDSMVAATSSEMLGASSTHRARPLRVRTVVIVGIVLLLLTMLVFAEPAWGMGR